MRTDTFKKKSILFVCMGNICRSPALQATLEKIIKNYGREGSFYVDSCGMGSWFLGEEADQRMQEAANERGICIHHRAQIFQAAYFNTFDYIFAVDVYVFEALQTIAPQEARSKLLRVTHFSQKYKDKDLPDPYYGNHESFKHVMEIIEDSCEGIYSFLIS